MVRTNTYTHHKQLYGKKKKMKMYESLNGNEKGYKCKRQDLGEYVTNITKKERKSVSLAYTFPPPPTIYITHITVSM